MDVENGVTRSIIHQLHSWDVQGEKMEDKSGVTRRIVDELHSSDIQRDRMEG